MSLPAVTNPHLGRFLAKVTPKKGRVIMTIDATQSRQPTWDMACTVTAQMFEAADGLDLQLCHYGGCGEFTPTPWFTSASAVTAVMTTVVCRSGRTQIKRAIQHAQREHQSEPINALILITDTVEEPATDLYKATTSSFPVFIFLEGGNPGAASVFKNIAKLSGGALCTFDAGAAASLAELLRGIAAYVAGGLAALANQQTQGARMLLAQIKSNQTKE